MKREKIVLVLSFILVCSLPVSAQLITPGESAIIAVIEQTGVADLIHYAQNVQQMVESIGHAYEQLQYTIEANKRALNNLKGIADVKSFDEFMKWNNRQLYLEQQTEQHFNNMGVQIGNSTYKFADIDKIPGALKDEFSDPLSNDFTEEQRAEMYFKLGLSPSNYAYIQTWQAREDYIAQRLLTRTETIAAEQQAAAQRNSALAQKYTTENENLDSNEILKDTGITLSNVEMVLRELTGLIAERNQYDLARDRQDDAPASDPGSTEDYWGDYWEPITKGSGYSEYID